MKLEKWGLIAEITSAIAIVISLIFVGVSIQQNTNVMQLTASSNMGIALSNINQSFALNPDYLELRLKRQEEGMNSLSGFERARLISGQHALTRLFQDYYYQYTRGGMEYVVWEPMEIQLIDFFEAGIWDAMWEQEGGIYNREFQEYINTYIIPKAQEENN